MKLRKIIIVLFFIVAVSTTGNSFIGTSTDSGKPFKEVKLKKGKCILYLGRLSAFYDGGAKYDIQLNGKSLGVLKQGAYMYKVLEPEQYTLRVKGGNRYTIYMFEVKENEARYFIYDGSDVDEGVFKKGNVPEKLKSLKLDFGIE